MSVNYLNEIISIFLDWDVNELSDNDLNKAIEAKGKVCTAEEINRVVKSFGSSLFQIRCNKEGIFFVRIEPKINICQDFLVGTCSSKPECNQLHICRLFGHCRKKYCNFHHDLNGRNNRRIVQQSNCQNVDPFLLVPLIQLYNRSSHTSFQNSPVTRLVLPNTTDMASSPVQPKPVQRVSERTDRNCSGRTSRDGIFDRVTDRDNLIQLTSLSPTLNINCQIDVSFPSISTASNITIEEIEAFLRFQGLIVQKILISKTNENFHQWTIQFEENDVLKGLLVKSIIPYRGFHLKFKRTNPIIDSKSFILQSTLDSKKGSVAIEKFSSYIDILIDRCSHKLTDLSSPSEQILLVQCDKIINFDQLRRLQKSRRQVQGRDVALKQVYEIETVIIESMQIPLSCTIVQNIIESVHENVFTFTVVSNQIALVEFIHADALKQWLSMNSVTKQKFNIDIKPRIECVDEDNRNSASRRSSPSQSIKSDADSATSQLTINLCRKWAMIAGHPNFSIEYKNYIRSEIGFEIDIRGDRVQIQCPPTSDTVFEDHPSSLLRNRTNNFMQKFAFRSVSLQQPTEQLAILRAHSSSVAFCSNGRNAYLLAARHLHIRDFMQKLLLVKQIDDKPINHLSGATSATQGPTKFDDQRQTSTFESATHPRIDEIITQKPQPRSMTFHVDEPGFEVLIDQNFNQLLAIVNSKCSLDKHINHQQIQIRVPTAKVFESDDSTSEVQSQDNDSEPPNDSNESSTNSNNNWFLELFRWNKPKAQSPKPASQGPSTTDNTTATLTIGKSKIIVCTGDLTKQAVDLIVVCSTSTILCDKITSAAGSEVENIYNQQWSRGILTFTTSGGNLPCKYIIFRPLIYNKNHLQNLKESIDTFVETIIKYAIGQNLTTIAFPSIGCGQLGQDPKIIAEHMIGETYRQLKTSLQSQLIVSFVLLPEQKNVYDAFTDQLSMTKRIDDTPTSISFDKQTVKITLTGSDGNVLIECQNKIKTLARSCSSKLHLSDKTDMADWPQTTIQKYYEYCLQKRVIPALDIQNSILDLIGPKDAVSEAEKYYFQLTTETLRNARIKIISREFVWSVEVSSGKWEQYSNEINDHIENAQMKNLPHIEFVNGKSERCRVIFSNMEEQYQQRKRSVCRKRIDASLPNYWDLSGGTFKRVVLLDNDKEYKDVVNRFDTTMKGHYSKIIKIERIQNERWCKQYAAHRDDFIQRYKQPDERLLFHGCSNIAADRIVHECFNRSFAGVNGTLYGSGVYFHEHAKYSDSYTRRDGSGEKTMFLARVLVGKKCVGNSSMKTPPEGFNTTTDGGHIFVIYHDAAAYGEYLIIYK